MVRINSLDEIKAIEYNMLLYVKELCENNGLRYYLHSGTLLGAIRHSGFIPWDDDVDICMPRCDILKLGKLIELESCYQLLSIDSDTYFYNFYKLVDRRTRLIENAVRNINNMGVYVDVFPIEGMPRNRFKRVFHYWNLNLYRYLINCFGEKKPEIRKNIFKYFVRFWKYYIITKCFDLTKLQKAYERVSQRYSFDDSEYVYVSGNRYHMNEIFEKAVFEDQRVELFESALFSVPKKSEQVLTQLYNDYQILPPIDKRVTNHSYQAFYCEDNTLMIKDS